MNDTLVYKAGNFSIETTIIRVVVYRTEDECPFYHVAEVWNGQSWEIALRGAPERYVDDSKDEAHYLMQDIKRGDVTL